MAFCVYFAFKRLHFSANHRVLNIAYCLSKRDDRVVRNERFSLIPDALFPNEESFLFQGGDMNVASLSNTQRTYKPKGLCFWGLNQEEVLVAWCYGRQRSSVDVGEMMEDFVLLE